MRKIIFVFTVLTLIIGCSHNIDEPNKDSAISGDLSINGGSVGGVWSIFTEGVAEAVRKEYPGTMINALPGTVAGNPVLVDQEKIEFAISESLTALFAYQGHSPFDEKHENIRAVAAIIPENVFTLIAPTSSPFNSVEEIIEQDFPIRYSPGEKDALGDVVSESVFDAYGITYEHIEEVGGEINFLSGGKSFDLMRDGRIDGLGKMVPIPAGDIIEASATIHLKLIPIGEKAINYLVETYSMTPYTIPAGSYDFQTKDYHTVNTPTILITNANVPDDIVYKVTKSIYEQLDFLADVHNGFMKITDETIIDVGDVPFHPGAKRFFQERNLLD